jgi:hypothetical protein
MSEQTSDTQTLEQRSTWLIGLWLSNDKPLYDFATSTVSGAPNMFSASEALRDAVTEHMDELLETLEGDLGGLTRDLVGSCFAWADWKAIAAQFGEVDDA